MISKSISEGFLKWHK